MNEKPRIRVQEQSSEQPPHRQRRLECLIVACLALGIWCLPGCVSTITPPANPKDPVTVYLLTDARHTGLVLLRPGGDYVEFGYGEWDWYVLNRDRWYNVFDTMLWPTQGTLGRRFLPADDGRTLGERYGSAKLEAIVVSGEKAADLLENLEGQYAKGLQDGPSIASHSRMFVKQDDGVVA